MSQPRSATPALHCPARAGLIKLGLAPLRRPSLARPTLLWLACPGLAKPRFARPALLCFAGAHHASIHHASPALHCDAFPGQASLHNYVVYTSLLRLACLALLRLAWPNCVIPCQTLLRLPGLARLGTIPPRLSSATLRLLCVASFPPSQAEPSLAMPALHCLARTHRAMWRSARSHLAWARPSQPRLVMKLPRM